MLLSKIKEIKNDRVIVKGSKTKDRNLTDINKERRNIENAYTNALADGDKNSHSNILKDLKN